MVEDQDRTKTDKNKSGLIGKYKKLDWSHWTDRENTEVKEATLKEHFVGKVKFSITLFVES